MGDELTDMSKDTLKSEIAALEEKTQNVNVELGVLAEYRRRVEEHAARHADLQSAVAQRDSAKKRCDDLRRLRLEGFMEGFSTISLRLKEMYQMITMGGNAELELVDSLDPFSEGILFSVMPPKKSWKNISNLSGGEKTLSSLALVFALHHYRPTPLYFMDEIARRWTSAMSLSLRTTSRTAQMTRSLSSSRCATTCSSSPTACSASTRRTTSRSLSRSRRPRSVLPCCRTPTQSSTPHRSSEPCGGAPCGTVYW